MDTRRRLGEVNFVSSPTLFVPIGNTCVLWAIRIVKYGEPKPNVLLRSCGSGEIIEAYTWDSKMIRTRGRGIPILGQVISATE